MSFAIAKPHLTFGLILLTLLAVGCPGTVPNVVGMQESEARAALAHAGLAVGAVISQNSDTVPEGRVISQSPPAGAALGEGAAVDLVVSLGAEPVLATVPDVTGLEEAAAVAALHAAGLVTGDVDEAYSGTVAAGLVISQNPAAGASVVEGSEVNLVLSLGPEPVVVPDLVGTTLADAQAALTAAGLAAGAVSEEYSATVAEGWVIDQAPEPGAPVAPGTAVDIVVSKGPEPGAVPYLKGMTRAQAESALLMAGLAVGDLTQTYNKNVPAGRVISQNPEAGTVVPASSPVDMTVSLGPQPVAVPDLVGMMQEEALAALPAAKLTAGAVTEQFTEDAAPGTVLSQQPEAGTIVDEDTSVDLVVATDFRLISTIEQFQMIGNDPDYPLDAKYALIKDLDAAAAGQYGGSFISIGAGEKQYGEPFAGIFDGRGHTISGIVIVPRSHSFEAPFYETAETAVIKDLHLTEISISGYGEVGGLCAMNRGEILNCTVTGRVSSQDMFAGGVAGYNYGAIRGCVFEGRIEEGTWHVGGIVGGNSGTVEDCHFFGEIANSYPYFYKSVHVLVGGIAGANEGAITDCSAAGAIRTKFDAGGIVGWNLGEVTGCQSWCNIIQKGLLGGGVAASNSGRIGRCGSYGLVYSTGGGVLGGLAGENYNSIEFSFAVGAVVNNGSGTGGLVAENSGTITDSFATAYVQGVENCGGLVGSHTAGSLTRCYSAGTVNATGTAGGLVASGNFNVNNCFWNTESSGQTDSAAGAPIDTNALLTPSTFTAAGWNYSDADGNPAVWAQIEGQTVPYLAGSVAPGTTFPLDVSAVNGSAIAVPAQAEYAAWSLVRLEAVGTPDHVWVGWDLFNSEPEYFLQTDTLYVTVHHPMTAQAVFLPEPIQLSSIEEMQQIGQDRLYPMSWNYVLANDIDASGTQLWNGGQGFLPIGDTERSFSGSLDGQGHSIQGLLINRPSEGLVGLFGQTGPESTIANLRVLDASVAGEDAGILAGINLGAISDCTVSGVVEGVTVGGFVAYNGYDFYMGMKERQGRIERCRSSATVSGFPYGSMFIGGFCSISTGVIEQCSAVGPVMGVAHVGGFLSFAEFSATIRDCYATGPVTGYMSVGGFISMPFGNLQRCYSAGPVQGEMAYGGFSGHLPNYYKEDTKYYFSDCFWDRAASGVSYSYGGTPLTTAEMMTAQPFLDAGWDFDNVWGIDEGYSYPYLLCEAPIEP